MTEALRSPPTGPRPLEEPLPEMRGHLAGGRARKTILGLGWSALNTGSATLIAALVFLITSRLLGPEEFGIVALAASILMFISCAAPGAFGEAIVQRARITSAHLDTIFWMCVLAAFLLYLPLLFLAGTIAEFTGQEVLVTLLPFIGLKLFLDLVAVVPQALVVRAMDFKYIAARTAIGNSVGGVVCIAMALEGFGLWALAMAPVITSMVSLAVLLTAARWRPGLALRRAALRDLWRFGLYSSGNRTLHTINLDQLVLGLLAGPAVLGLYFLGRRLFDLLSGMTAGAVYPVSAALFAALQFERSKHVRAYALTLQASGLASFPVFAGLFVLAETAVPLVLGAHWQPAIPAVQGFAIIGLAAGLHAPSASLASGLGRADLWFIFELSRQVLSVAAIAFFLRGGLSDIMVALAVVNLALAPGCFLVASKLTGITLRQYAAALRAPLASTAVMCGAILALPWLLSASTGMLLALQIVLGGAVYILTVLAMTGQQIADVKQAFGRGG